MIFEKMDWNCNCRQETRRKSDMHKTNIIIKDLSLGIKEGEPAFFLSPSGEEKHLNDRWSIEGDDFI